MDSRINQIVTLKDVLTSRNSQVIQTLVEQLPDLPSPEDVEYKLIRKQVISTPFFKNTNKHTQIRLQQWLELLDKISTNKVWISTRNKYIKLLNLMCYCEVLIQPFQALPPEGQLPNLQKHQLNQIINEVENRVKHPKANSKKITQRTITSETLYTQQSEVSNISFRRRHPSIQYSFSRLTLQEDRLHNRALNSFDTNIANLNSSFQKKESLSKDKDHKMSQNREQKIDRIEKKTKKCFSSLKKQNSQLKQVKLQKSHFNKNKKKPPVYQNKPKPLQGYWDSRCTSDIHTPKYMNNIEQEEPEVVIVSVRGNQKEQCFCSGSSNEQWWTNFIKMMF